MVLTIKQYKNEYTKEIKIYDGIPYTVDRQIYTATTCELKRIPTEISLPADVFGCFKVNPDTTEIYVELKRYPQMIGYFDSWQVPYCKTDFMYYHKKDPMIYITLAFVNGRIISDYLYGYQKFLHKSMPYSVHNKVEDTSKECQTFYRADIPDEAKELCAYVPLDTIDIW